MTESYNPYKKTAMTRRSLSVPMRELMNLRLLNLNILDFGCGHGFDVNFLSYLGVDIVGYDKYNPEYKDESLLDKKYNVVVANYVLNVIPNLVEHQQVIDKLRVLGDNIYIAVRSDVKAIKKDWIHIKEYDCYKTSKNSYQRFYTSHEIIQKYFGEVEYLIDNNSTKLFKLK